MQFQPFCSPFQIGRRRVEADQSLCPPLGEEAMQQLALSTAQIGDRLGAGRAKRLDHCRHPFVVEPPSSSRKQRAQDAENQTHVVRSFSGDFERWSSERFT